jgi:hypothetical protein
MTTSINREIWKELEVEITAHGHMFIIETYGRMCLESPEIALALSALGSQSMSGGALVYEAMQRQIRKDALAALERQ